MGRFTKRMKEKLTLEHRQWAALGAVVVLAASAGGAGAMAMTRPSIEMAPTVATPIAKLASSSGIVTVKGRVAEVFGNRIVVQDGSGRAMIDAGPDGASNLTTGAPVMVQGRYDQGQLRAQFLVGPNGAVEAVGPAHPPHGPGAPPPPPGAGPAGPPPPPPFSMQLEAESASVSRLMTVEGCSEGGQDMGNIQQGGFLTFNNITFPTSGSYLVEYRVASGAAGGTVSCDLNGGTISLGLTTIPGTGGWQNWTTVSKTVTITAGTYNFGIYAQTGGYNLNWVRITKQGAARALATTNAAETALALYPNPVRDRLTLAAGPEFAGSQLSILSVEGRLVWRGTHRGEPVDVSALRPGLYTLLAQTADGRKVLSRFSKE